jgi:hypothetical protein
MNIDKIGSRQQLSLRRAWLNRLDSIFLHRGSYTCVNLARGLAFRLIRIHQKPSWTRICARVEKSFRRATR